MDKEIHKVLFWQSIFGRKGHIVSKSPIIVPQELAKQRAEFLYEEIQEYLDANEAGDIVEILDALCDILYFLFGMVVIHGLQKKFTQAFEIVHQSNMSKLDDDGKIIIRESDGKVLKGKNYWKPREKLEKLLGYKNEENIIRKD
jgi:predicted HAD superfamily Cof-like phosphohydrolase